MPNDGYYYCLNCHSEITPDYNEHCCFCGSAAVAVSGDYSPEEVETAFDLLNKQQQGLVIVPPVKPGDTVYAYCEYFGVLPYLVGNFHIGYMGKEENYLHWEAASYATETDELLDEMDFDLDDIRKYVFFTREEAEQALKEGAGNA